MEKSVNGPAPVSEDDFADAVRGISNAGGSITEQTNKVMVDGMTDSIKPFSDDAEPFVDKAEEAKFIDVHGGPSGQLHNPEEAAAARVDALDSIRWQVQDALQRFRKITKQSHTADRLLLCLTPTASMPDRLPFTPSASGNIPSRNRDDHILHLASAVILSWGIFMRYGDDGLGTIAELNASVELLGDIVRDPRRFKVYPVDPRSSLFTLRLVSDQAKLNKVAEDEEANRFSRLSETEDAGDAEGAGAEGGD